MLCGKPLHHDDTRGTLNFHLGRFSNNFEIYDICTIYLCTPYCFSFWLAQSYSHRTKHNIDSSDLYLPRLITSMGLLHFQGINIKQHAIIRPIQSKFRQEKPQISEKLDELADTQI